MSSGMFRGKESSNRIELSQLVQDLLSFGVLGSLWLWGWGVVAWGWVVVGGCPHTCAHAHVCTHLHTCTCTHGKHDNFMGESLGIPYDVICVCVCMHACVCMCMCVRGLLSPPPTHIHPPPSPRGGPQESVKIQ